MESMSALRKHAIKNQPEVRPLASVTNFLFFGGDNLTMPEINIFIVLKTSEL